MSLVMPAVEFLGLGKTYNNRSLLTDVNLTVMPGDFMVIYGAPASGKSVLMRLLMGLEQPTSGRVMLRGQDVTNTPASERNVGYVPQSFALYPHMSVADNIAYPLHLAHAKASEIEPVVRQVAAMLKIEDLLAKRPDQLSGGQKQRVAIARGIAKRTEIYVLDDPLTGLDFKLREQLVDDLKELQQTWRVTFVYTTSDPIEALTLADHVAILADGRIVDSGEPVALYDDPGHVETMSMLGFPRANFLDGSLSQREGRLWCETALFQVPVEMTANESAPITATVGIRPEHLRLIAGNGQQDGRLTFPANVILREDLGGEEIVYLDVNGTPLTTVVRHDAEMAAGDGAALVALAPHHAIVFDPRGDRLGQGTEVPHG